MEKDYQGRGSMACIMCPPDLVMLQEKINSCKLCPLSFTRNHAVPGSGPSKAEIMLIGEAPGREEDLKGLPFTVYRGHRRIFDYVDDTCRTFANIADNFLPGRVYNVGGREEWAISIEELADLVLEITGADPRLARFEGEEAFTTRVKLVDFSLARRELGHDPQVDIREGITRYVAWARKVYGV